MISSAYCTSNLNCTSSAKTKDYDSITDCEVSPENWCCLQSS